METKPKTNANRIRAMTDDPLPECLACPDFADKAQDDLEEFYGRADHG